MSLLNSVSGVMTNKVIDSVTDVLGIENSLAKSAIKMFLPAIIGGVINKGSSSSGAGGLLDLFKKGGFGDDNLEDLAGVFGNEEKRSGWLDTGADLLGTIFGNRQSGILDMLLKATGIGKGAGSSLLAMLAPIVINKLAGIVMGKGMNASQLTSYLSDQKSETMGLVPGLGDALGINATSSSNESSSGGGMMKWLLPLLLAALAFWFMSKNGCGNKTATTVESEEVTTTEEVDSNTTESIETTTTNNTTEEVETVSAEEFKSYTVADNGDILTGSGSVAYAAGSYDLDADGNLVDVNGRILASVASIGSDFMTKLKNALSTFKLEKMKLMFSDMIVKKEGSNSSYGLSDIVFNKENHKITNFTKSEVIGLAEALKANATGKIEVHVYTDDAGDKAKANDKLSNTRANVIRDMLVTLGVKADQIKAVGKGSSDAAKASAEKVDIVVN